MKKSGHRTIGMAVMVITGLIITILLRELFSKDKTSQVDLYSKWQNTADSYFGYTLDSLYKVECDTIIRVSDTRSGKTINEFHVYLSTFPEYPFLRQMEIDPSGKYLAILDNRNIASIYNIFTGELEGLNDYYFDGSSHIYFSEDSKYFLIVDYREAEVDVLSCPGLGYIATGYMGYYRSNFWWEDKNKKLVFYYEVVDSLYKTVFPDDGHGDSLVFSKPVYVDKVANESQADE